MNTETNATIDAIMGDVKSFARTLVLVSTSPDDGSMYATAEGRYAALRTAIAAALDSRARQGAELHEMLTEHQRECEACFAIAQRLDAGNSALPGSFTGAPSERIARQIEALTAERDELRKRLDAAAEQEPTAWQIKQGARTYMISNTEFARASFDAAEMTPLYAAPVVATPATPATPAPGEWIEWRGGVRPIGDVLHEVRFRTGRVSRDIASGWHWGHNQQPWDIIAYRVL